jgi:two-component system, LytTR family, sensor kinase
LRKNFIPDFRYFLFTLVLIFCNSGLFANIDLLESKKIHYYISKGDEEVKTTIISEWPVFENFDWDNIAKGNQLYLAFTFDVNSIDEPAIWFDATLKRFKIIQDSSLLYATGLYPDLDPMVLKLHPKQKSTIIISSSFSSRELSYAIFTIKLGEYRGLLKDAEKSTYDLLIDQLSIILISAIILFFGILSLAFFIVRWRDKNFAFLYYGIAVSVSAFVNIDIRLIHLSIDLPDWLLTFFQLNGRFGVFALFLLFIRQIFELERIKIVNNALYATFIYWLIAVLSFYLIPSPVVFSILSIGYGAFAFIVLGLVVYYVSKSKVLKELPDKQIFLFFIFLFLVVIIYSLGSMLLSMETHRQVPIYLGVFAMSLAMLSLLIGRYVQMERVSFNYEIELEKQKNELLKLQQANVEAQYASLKSQLNPHFLFNSLSTLSSLVYPVAYPEVAKEFIDEFSKIFRYMLDVHTKDLVSLNDELGFLKSYIFLQELRFPLGLSCNINIDSIYYNRVLPPLALQIPVENAIKHNQVSKEKPLNIEIFVEEDMLIIKNNLQKKYIKDIESTQVGLNNLKERYSVYNVTPKIIELRDYYIVKIPLLKDDHDKNPDY